VARDNGGLERIGFRRAAKPLRVFKSGQTTLNLGAIPNGAVLVGEKNSLAIESPARGGAGGVEFQQGEECLDF
jgi:hypothetical protein